MRPPFRIPALRRGGAGLLMFFAVGLAHAALFERTVDNLQREATAAKADGKQLAVVLTMPDCPSCLEMEKTVYADRSTERAVGRSFRTVRLDISRSATIIDALGHSTTPADLATRLRAVGTPSFIFFAGDGNFLYRHTGTLDRTGLRDLVDYVALEKFEKFPFTVRKSR